MELVSVRDEELVMQGWTRMFTIETSRVPEYVELYEEMGLQVLVEAPAARKLDPNCAECYASLRDSFQTIYTRPKQA